MDADLIKKQLGLRLKELRQEKKLRQDDMEKFKFNPQYYARMEQGKINPTMDTLIRLCEIFEISMSEMFMFMDSEQAISEDKESIAVKVSKILHGKSKKKIHKLKILLDEIL